MGKLRTLPTRRGSRKAWGAVAALASIALAAPPAARAQVEDLGPPPRPILIYLAEKPSVTAVFAGDFGPVRVTGVLEETPKTTVRLTDASGRSRQAQWSEIRDLALVQSAAEGLPLGSFTVHLSQDPPAPNSGSDLTGTYSGTVAGGYLSPAFSTPGFGQTGWRLLKMPSDQLTLRGDAYGRLAIPTDRLSVYYQEAVRGTIAQLPAGSIRIQVLQGKEVSLPLPEVQSFRRDIPGGTITLALLDGQIFSGKLIELPKVSLKLESAPKAAPIPLSGIVEFEVTVPTGARAGGQGSF